ncbi:MAG: glycosyltransferase involved in cell wall biosynthesis [Cryomorphaceae bacterium]
MFVSSNQHKAKKQPCGFSMDALAKQIFGYHDNSYRTIKTAISIAPIINNLLICMPDERKKFDLSVVVPVMNEENNIFPFLEEVSKHCLELNISYEILFINDGSTDSTLETLRLSQITYPLVKILNLSRNFGKEIALSAGLDHSNARTVIPMDVDLQDPPSIIIKLYERHLQGFDVVVAIRKKRDGDSINKIFFARAFHWFFEKISDTPISKEGGDFRLMSERVVNVIRQMPERSRFMKGVFAWPGYKTSQIYYDRPSRSDGKTKFGFIKLWNLALDGMFSFSTLPLRIWTYIGAMLATLSIIFMLFTVIKTMIFGIDLPGYASLLTFMLLLGGINLIGIGMLGEYIGRIFIEVKGRPLYVVESIMSSEDNEEVDD